MFRSYPYKYNVLCIFIWKICTFMLKLLNLWCKSWISFIIYENIWGS